MTSHKLTQFLLIVAALIVVTASSFAGSAPTNVGVSDHKAGSFLVFPFYNSKNGAETTMTLSNVGQYSANVHLLFMDGASCNQADTHICLTANASIEIKASEYDPQNSGYLLAFVVDNQGLLISYNGLIGNAFVNDGEYVGNYGAESFASLRPLGAFTDGGLGPFSSIFMDGVRYDLCPTAFAVEIKSPLSSVNQKIVLAGLFGALDISRASGIQQVGVGVAYNGQEAARSFSSFFPGGCFSQTIIDGTHPRVPSTLSTLIPKGEVGTLQFNVTAAVGLIMSSNKSPLSGIRTLHVTQVGPSRIDVPQYTPPCQIWNGPPA
jgi:hypothetical protein